VTARPPPAALYETPGTKATQRRLPGREAGARPDDRTGRAVSRGGSAAPAAVPARARPRSETGSVPGC